MFCRCGRCLGELAGGVWRTTCLKCRDILIRQHFEKKQKRGDLLVVHSVDLALGQLVPELTQIVLYGQPGHRYGADPLTRGGQQLPPATLWEAIAGYRQPHDKEV